MRLYKLYREQQADPNYSALSAALLRELRDCALTAEKLESRGSLRTSAEDSEMAQ
jgi:hypothetical protein